MAAWPTQLSTPPLSDPLVDVVFVMLEIGEPSMHVNARGPTEMQLSTALENSGYKRAKDGPSATFSGVQHSSYLVLLPYTAQSLR